MLYIAHILLCVSMLINDSLGGFLALICADIFFVLVFSLCKGKFRLISLLPIGIFIVTTIICCLLSSQINENISRNIRQLFDDSAVVSKNVNLINDYDLVIVDPPRSGLTKETIKEYIEKITVYEDEKIDVILKYFQSLVTVMDLSFSWTNMFEIFIIALILFVFYKFFFFILIIST